MHAHNPPENKEIPPDMLVFHYPSTRKKATESRLTQHLPLETFKSCPLLDQLHTEYL